MQNYLCENLKRIRKENKLSQQQFATFLGINRSTYAHHEKHGIPHKYIPLYFEILSKKFGIKMSELIDKEKSDFNSDALIESIELIEQGLSQIKIFLKTKI